MTHARRTWARAALAGVVVVTAVWWALALWPLPAHAPGWLSRTRAVCFGTTASGLPDVQGWMLLFLQPALMLGQVLAIWGRDLSEEAARLSRSAPGRFALGGVAVVLVLVAGAAAARVRAATSVVEASVKLPAKPGWTRVGTPAPPLELVGAGGEPVTLAALRGRPVVVAFAFAHCQTACPLIVREVLAAQRSAGDAAVIVVTLDPWRDTPSRLPSIEERWKMDAGARMASGSVAQVAAVLKQWGIEQARNRTSGDILHVPRVFLVDREGMLAYEADPDAELLTTLLTRL